MVKGEIFGTEYQLSTNNLKDVYESDFTECFNYDENFFAHSKTMDSEDESCPFKYQLVIEGTYCEGRRYYELALVVMPESICEKILSKIKDDCGCSENELEAYDVKMFGLSVTLGSTYEEVDEDNDEGFNMETIYHIANVSGLINRIRGFYLDRTWNAIGNTGWDVIEECLHGVNRFDLAIKRWEDSKAE